MKFEDLNICAPILRALQEEGYEVPTAIQEQAIPVLLGKKDLLGCAQTGTGKTAAFAIPILQMLHEEKMARLEKEVAESATMPVSSVNITDAKDADSVRALSQASSKESVPEREPILTQNPILVQETVPLQRQIPTPVSQPLPIIPEGAVTYNPSKTSLSARRRNKGKLPQLPSDAIPVVIAPNPIYKAISDALDVELLEMEAPYMPEKAQERVPETSRPKRRGKVGDSRIQADRASSKAVQPIRALILTPTRELALQIEESFETYGRHLGLSCTVVYGGVRQGNQVTALKNGVDILVATPGRLLDLVNQRLINLHHIRWFVLDEADRMLDMGFAPDVKRIIGMIPKIRQTMMFSATMPMEIMHLVDTVLTDPEEVTVTPVASTVESIEQYVYYVNRINKRHLLVWLLKKPELRSVLVFSKTKHGAERLGKDLESAGIANDTIHGDKAQQARQQALNDFKRGTTRVLVATDIAARGIDVDNLSHVINFDIPDLPETYVHRIGRTGRAGMTGVALTFCDEEEKLLLRDIRKLTGSVITEVTDHPFAVEQEVEETSPEKKIPFAGTKTKRRGRRPGTRSFG